MNVTRALIVGCGAIALWLFAGSVQAASVSGVQSGSVTITTQGTTTVNIAPVVMSRSVLFFSSRHNNNRPGGSMVRARLASSTSIEIVSVRNATFTVQWYLAEFASGVNVQRGSVNQTGSTINVGITPVAALNQAFVTWSKTPATSDSVWSQDDPIIADLTATNNLQIRVNNANGSHVIWWQVVEFTNPADINVQRGTASLTGAATAATAAITAVDLSRSFVLAGFRTSGSGSDIDERLMLADFPNATTVRFLRGDSGDDITEIGWQVVELLDGSTVQGGLAVLANAATTSNQALTAVDLARAVAFGSVQAAAGQSLGGTLYDTDDIIGYASTTLTLNSPTQVTAQRAVGGETSAVGWFVVEFNQAPVVLTPVADWRFDEGSWNGSVDEVIDSSGNDYHGFANNASPVPGLLCNAADLTANSTADYLNMDANAMNGLGDFTVSVWGQTTSNADSTIVSAARGNSSLQANEAVMYFDNANRFWPTITDSPFDTSTRFNIGAFNSGTWRHMAWTRQAATRQSCFYLDGVLQGCTTHPDANDTNPLTVVAGGLIIGQDQDSLGGSFDINQDWQGLLDELVIFPRVLAAAEIQSIRTNNLAGNNWDGTPRVCAVLDQLQITVAPNASTCVASSVTVQALDSGGNPLSDYTGTIDLSTSTNNGNWTVTAGGGTLVPDPDIDDNGAASYTFVAADGGGVTFDLSNAHADDLTITAQDTAAGVSATSGVVSFRDNAFVITNNEFVYPVAGRDHAFDVTLWQRDTSLAVPDCQIATAYNGVQNLDGWYDPGAAHPGGAAAPALEQLTNVFPLGLGVAAATPVDLVFNNGVAAFSLRTTDVGQYTINLRDDTATFATVTITGASSELTVRPFGFAITGIAAGGPNPGGTTPGGILFNAAGDPFQAQFTAVLYGAGDPLDANGNPTSWIALENNANAPSFAWATDLGAVLNTPPLAIGGATGILDRPGGTQITAAEFIAGGALPTDLRYSEVGSMFMSASADNYLGVAGLSVQGQSQVVGRFNPAEFTVTGTVSTYDAACTAFTYLGQPFDYSAGARPVATITAVNALGATTLNYFDFGVIDNDWWLLGDIAETYDDPPRNLIYSGVGPSHNSTEFPTANGQVVVNFVGPLMYTKPIPYTDGVGVDPFMAAPTMSFSVVDGEGVAFNGGADFTFNIPEAVGQNWVRHGRLQLQSAHGSEVLDLSAPLLLQTFDMTNFVTQPNDACTAVAVADFTYVGVPIASGVTPFAAGVGSLDWACSLASPCPSGFVDVTGALAGAGLDWLRYDWDGDNVEDEPAARVTFGIHAGSNRNIHIREMF